MLKNLYFGVLDSSVDHVSCDRISVRKFHSTLDILVWVPCHFKCYNFYRVFSVISALSGLYPPVETLADATIHKPQEPSKKLTACWSYLK